MKDAKVHILKPDQLVIKKQHSMLDSSKKMFTFGFNFVPEQNSLSQKQMGKLPYYIFNNATSTLIEGTFVMDNSEKDKVITLIVYQGNSATGIRLKNEEIWHNALKIPVDVNATTEVTVEIQWDSKSSEELSIFPIHHDRPHFYNGASIGFRRIPVLNKHQDDVTDSMLAKQTFSFSKSVASTPTPTWLDTEDKNLNLIIRDNQTYTRNPIKKLKLNPVPYNTEVDIIWVDEYGRSKVLRENVTITENTPQIIEFTKDELTFLESGKGKQFLVILNNRNQMVLADYKAVQLGKKPGPTTFEMTLEYYKTIE